MGSSGSQFKLSRTILLGFSAALVLGAACSGNPELHSSGQAFNEGHGLNEPCPDGDGCAPPLVCGPSKVCVETCGDALSDSCGDEACLPSGVCSVGLGRDCDDATDCRGGLTCSASFKHCSVPCVPGASGVCNNGEICRADGTCRTSTDLEIVGVGGAANQGTGGDQNSSGGSSSCIDLDVDFTPQVPTVLLLIDRSGSMTAGDNFGTAVKAAVDDGTYELGDCPSIRQNNQDVNPNDWRWNVVRDVLMNPVNGIVKPLEGQVRFGMALYDSNNGRIKPAPAGMPNAKPERDPNKECPRLIQVPIALDNHQAMLDQFKCSDVGGDTPTAESLLAAAATLKAYTEPGPKLIVLATDGEPDTCDCPNFNGRVPEDCTKPDKDGVEPADAARAQVVTTAQTIHGDDITIHVINVSTPSLALLQKHLTDVANAGGGNVYPGFSPGALSTAFEDIINGARSCVIDLDGEIAPGKDSDGVITLDGDELKLDDPDGWQVNSPSQIELLGEACEDIKKGGHAIAIKFPCDSFKPPVH
jgi:hypothetical protein